jgi:uncharacterized membrane protein
LRGDGLRHNALNFLKFLAIFTAGAFAYGLIEVSARGFTHISMGLLGGAAMYLIHLMNTPNRTPVRIFLLLTVSAVFITVGELITGEIVNVRMGLNIWDYSMLPMNFDGQICLPFTMLWFSLSAVGMVFDDFLRRKLFSEKREIVYIKSKERTAV